MTETGDADLSVCREHLDVLHEAVASTDQQRLVRMERQTPRSSPHRQEPRGSAAGSVQTRTVRSALPVAHRRPSGDHSREGSVREPARVSVFPCRRVGGQSGRRSPKWILKASSAAVQLRVLVQAGTALLTPIGRSPPIG